jgi:demethylmenaquinone methyltransferase/2-methoxy-6-polyprenyl-1,4-benzoquinol methylase
MELSLTSRVTRSHAQARSSYDRLSRWYDLIEGGWENQPRRLGLDFLQLIPGERVLEIGCGTGSSLVELTCNSWGVENAWTVGLDLSVGMLAKARGRLEEAGLPTILLQGDALYLPFLSAYFDAVFMAFTLELIDSPEIPVVLCEVQRVLKCGGRLGVVSISKLGGIGFMQRLSEWAHSRFPDLVDCRPIYTRHSLEEAGFSVVRYQLISHTGLGIEVVVGDRSYEIHS